MASGNRVEELEARVKELEASVTGLTDELLECKERLRVLEDEVDPEIGIIEGRVTRSEAGGDGAENQEQAAEAEQADNDNSGESEEGGSDSGTDEIIVA
jgi:hypothetical protein